MKLKEKIKSYLAVLKVAKKPSFADFKFTAKICGISLILLGVVGFILYIISTLLIG